MDEKTLSRRQSESALLADALLHCPLPVGVVASLTRVLLLILRLPRTLAALPFLLSLPFLLPQPLCLSSLHSLALPLRHVPSSRFGSISLPELDISLLLLFSVPFLPCDFCSWTFARSTVICKFRFAQE